MDSTEIRKKFLNFFQEKGHRLVLSSPLVSDDSSVLLTTAGMQQFKKYFLGELDAMRDFGSLNVVSAQKCFRTTDIDEVGDATHLTFLEMLGNFSFGGYFKSEAIRYAYEFITEVMKLEIDYVTIFDNRKVKDGDWRCDVEKDQEAYSIWREIGIPERKIKSEGVDNFWGPTGAEGPCGPTTEIYINGVEVWNIVFNQFYCDADRKLTPLKINGVDTGMGLERLAAVFQGRESIYHTKTFKSILELLPEEIDGKVARVIADHVRGISFLIADGIRPSNKDAGYILRKLMRRIIVHAHLNDEVLLEPIFEKVVSLYEDFYPELDLKMIMKEFNSENIKFQKTIMRGLKELDKPRKINAKTAFLLYESFGLPFEIIKEIGGDKTFDLTRKDFDREFERHREISKKGQEKKFGGHGLILDTGELKAKDRKELEKVTRLHTATHLLQSALRKVLGDEVKQMGSDITVERTRFDFSFPRKLTPEEIKKIEDLVNEVIKDDSQVQYKEMPIEKAKKTGALYFFREKYPERVKVYYVGKSLESAFSKEFCGGPHVSSTGEIGEFKIIKEESVGVGVRRIRAVVKP